MRCQISPTTWHVFVWLNFFRFFSHLHVCAQKSRVYFGYGITIKWKHDTCLGTSNKTPLFMWLYSTCGFFFLYIGFMHEQRWTIFWRKIHLSGCYTCIPGSVRHDWLVFLRCIIPHMWYCGLLYNMQQFPSGVRWEFHYPSGEEIMGDFWTENQ